jgi:6-pyruvoyltetrahydropterin/6-carboxytetrahydropterin synthase
LITLSRRYRFPAAHVLRSDALSDEENARTYGKCSSLHGHDYGVEVTVTGTPDASGRIVPVEQLDALVGEHVLTPLAHTNLSEHPLFAERISTAENVARVVHERLTGPIERETPARLLRVRIQETRKNGFEYGDDR